HTRFSRDWSSDVCSSDLHAGLVQAPTVERHALVHVPHEPREPLALQLPEPVLRHRLDLRVEHLPSRARSAPSQARSTTMAMPWPTPMHIVARPTSTSVLTISCSSVVRMRAPEQPKGCPSAMAPPLGLTRASSVSRPSSLSTAIDCAAN